MRVTPVSFGGRDLSALLYVEQVSRAVVPARDLSTTTVAGRHGTLLRSSAMGALEITVRAHVRAMSVREVAEARRVLAAALWSEGEAELVLPDEPDKANVALYEGGAELGRDRAWPEVELPFYCADPVAYGREREQALTSSSAVTVRAGGTWRALPTVTATPARGSSWTIRNVDTGAYVTVMAAFTGSQKVRLDMARERCQVNGSDHMVTIGSDFFGIEGTQRLSVSSGTATVAWREAWL